MAEHMSHEEFVATAINRVCALSKSIIEEQTPILDGAYEMFGSSLNRVGRTSTGW